MSLESILAVAAIIFAIGLYGGAHQAERDNGADVPGIDVQRGEHNGGGAVALRRAGRGWRATLRGRLTRWRSSLLTGQVFAIFIITVAAAEVALGLAIVIAIYRSRQSVFVTDANQMSK